MTVAQLIAKLQAMPQSDEIRILAWDSYSHETYETTAETVHRTIEGVLIE